MALGHGSQAELVYSALGMDGLTIFLLCLLCLAFVYVVMLCVCFACLFTFRARLEKRLVAMSVVYSEMRDVLLSWKELLEREGCRWDEKMTNAGAQIASLRTELKSEHESLSTYELLSGYEKELKRLSRGFPSVLKDEDYLAYSDTFGDLDASHRRIVALYNGDQNGYEYWRKSIPFRPFTLLAGFRKRERLS